MDLRPDIHWYGRRLLRRLGIPGTVGLLFAMLAPTILLGGILPMQREVAGLRQQLAQKPAQRTRSMPVVAPEQALEVDLQAFQDRFPAVDQLSDQLDTLFDLTDNSGLAVDKGEYALVEKAGGAMRRFEVTLPVTGSYLQVRSLMVDVLGKLPAAALADITIERDRIADGRAKATLRLVFFVRKSA